MLLFASGRTDIPAFYADWLMERVRAGFVDVRNPYYARQVTRYRLSPDVVDCLVFCTKNPAPMLPHLPELRARLCLVFFRHHHALRHGHRAERSPCGGRD